MLEAHSLKIENFDVEIFSQKSVRLRGTGPLEFRPHQSTRQQQGQHYTMQETWTCDCAFSALGSYWSLETTFLIGSASRKKIYPENNRSDVDY